MKLLACLTLALAPQLELGWEFAYLGSLWRLQLEGAPGAPFALLPSLESGPTSLPLLGPARLAVGLDLPDFWQVGLLDGQGRAARDFGLPVNPNLVGLPLRAQAFTFPGAQGLIDALSAAVEAQVGNLGQSHLQSGAVLWPRRDHSATELADGRVLVVGGRAQGPWPLTLELFDPASNRFSASQAQLPQGRALHTATRLPDGRVLIAGGVREDGSAYANGLLYDPASDSLSAPVPLGAPRVGHSATRLLDGRVALVGGSTAHTLSHPLGWPAVAQNPAPANLVLFDPLTSTASPGPALPRPRLWHSSVLLGNGQLLVVGGLEAGAAGLATSADCRRFDPQSGQWSAAAPLPAPRALHGLVGTADGGALAISGAEVDVAAGSLAGKLQCWSFAGGTWTSRPDSLGIIIGGEEQCLPRRPIPTPSPVPGGTPGDLIETGPVIVYFAGGGYSSVDLGSGAATTGTAFFAIDPAYSAWKPAAQALVGRQGESFTSLDQTVRCLRVGAANAPGDPGAETTVLRWWLP